MMRGRALPGRSPGRSSGRSCGAVARMLQQPVQQLAEQRLFVAAQARIAKGLALTGPVTLPQVSVFVDDSSGTGCSGWKGCCGSDC